MWILESSDADSMAEPGAHLKRNVQECALEGEGEDEEESPCGSF